MQIRSSIRRSTLPSIALSAAFDTDVALAEMRAGYEGYEYWLNNVERGSQYTAGGTWGCVGRWFSGRWHTAPAKDFIKQVNDYLDQRIWETAGFQEP